jgi:hypothetical protein
MTLTTFPDSQVLTSLCSDVMNQPYWLFRVFRGDADPRVYRLPEFPSDWPVKARWNQPEDREPLLTIARR